MMIKRFAVFCTVLVSVCALLCAGIPAAAKDDKTYYGDGTSASWEDLSQYLSPLYRNTPYINVSNGSSSMKFYFNTELFADLGLYVYGEPDSVQFTGTVNDFKAADYGYFRVQSGGITRNGEYRYLGYSLSGVPMTNTRFPNEVHTDFSEMTLMKYTDLPESLKETYQVSGIDNTAYDVIRDLIEAKDSPVWDFENMNNGIPITLRERLEGFGLMQGGVPSISLLDYAIVYSWAETGGILRVFYQSKNNKEVIRYATFTGPVSIDFVRKMPGFTSELSLPDNHPDLIGDRTFYLGPGRKFLSLNLDMRAVLQDNYASLTEFGRAHSYTRAHIKSLTLSANNTALKNTELRYGANDVTARGSVQNYRIQVSALRPGRNTVSLFGNALVQLGQKYLLARCTLEIVIIYEPGQENSPSPSFSASPAPSATAAPTPAVTPRFSPEKTAAPSPSLPPFKVSRKW